MNEPTEIGYDPEGRVWIEEPEVSVTGIHYYVQDRAFINRSSLHRQKRQHRTCVHSKEREEEKTTWSDNEKISCSCRFFLLFHSILFLSSTTKNRNNRTNFLFFSIRYSQETDHLKRQETRPKFMKEWKLKVSVAKYTITHLIQFVWRPQDYKVDQIRRAGLVVVQYS